MDQFWLLSASVPSFTPSPQLRCRRTWPSRLQLQYFSDCHSIVGVPSGDGAYLVLVCRAGHYIQFLLNTCWRSMVAFQCQLLPPVDQSVIISHRLWAGACFVRICLMPRACFCTTVHCSVATLHAMEGRHPCICDEISDHAAFQFVGMTLAANALRACVHGWSGTFSNWSRLH
jgi:hypothetical protein